MDIRFSNDIDKLALSYEAKERAKQILWNKGSKALKEFLQSATLYKLGDEHIVKVMKELYPDERPDQIQERVEHMKALIAEGRFDKEPEAEKKVSIKEKAEGISCRFCGGNKKSIVPVCEDCLHDIEEGDLEVTDIQEEK